MKKFQESCSQFCAGDTLRSRTRYIALDETAIFGGMCRHDIPLCMLSLKHGERYNFNFLCTCINITMQYQC